MKTEGTQSKLVLRTKCHKEITDVKSTAKYLIAFHNHVW